MDFLNEKTWKEEVPPELAAYYDAEKYSLSQRYNKEKNRLSFWSDLLGFAGMIVFLCLHGFGWLGDELKTYIADPIWMALAYFGILSVVNSIVGLPLGVYNTFVIEEKYGFNRTTVKTYILDMIKGSLLAAALACTLGYFIIWLIVHLRQDFWIYAWATATAFMLFLNVFYTSLIVPLFNKLKPLEEGELRTAIEEYSHSVGFPLGNVMVMNGSKRSSRANAYFSGIGATKKIVLFDTLIEKHTVPELVSVLAHEVGHYKRKHIVSGLITSVLVTGFTLWVLSKFIFNEDLSLALGAHSNLLPVNMIAFGVLYGPISSITGLFGNVMSRRHEYQADAFAGSTSDKGAFKQALIKLSIDNLSNLLPHPAYVFFNYSHPPVLDRIKAMDT